MPALGTAIAGIITAFKATAIGTFLTTTFTGRLLASVAISALQAALVPHPRQPGITTEFTANGGTNPCGFVLGQYATAGDAVCPPMSFGKVGKTPNAYLTYVIALSDVAGQTLSRVAIDGAWVSLGTVAHADFGLPLTGKYDGYAWVKYYDGSQTVADPQLMRDYASYPERPWAADMVGTGICYAILTFRFNRQLFPSLPAVLFEAGGIKLYDPRADSTAGGSGAQRWGNAATWQPTLNNAVMAYNIMRGIQLPGSGVWGGSISGDDLPTSNWFAAMNACDVAIGTPALPQYRGGYEVRVDMEPAAVIEELLKACTGQLAEVGGTFKVRVGGPGLPVLFITDDDIIVSKPQDYDPFPQADQRFNGIDAKYPDPATVWQAKSALPRYNAAWEAEDGERRVTSLDLPACPFPKQVQRIMKSYITDERRYRRHNMTLPPDAAVLEPLDTISWTSERNGYVNKLFEVAQVADSQKTMLQQVSLREIDPTDYDPASDWEVVPSTPSHIPVTPSLQTMSGWIVSGISIPDASGSARRPALLLAWSTDDMEAVDGVKYEIRLKATGVVVATGSVSDVDDGSRRVTSGILAATTYEARAKPIARGRSTGWTGWYEATTPTTGLRDADFENGIYQLFKDQGLFVIRDVTSLPGAGAFTGEKLFNRTDGKLYQWTGAAWVLVIADVGAGSLTPAAFAANVKPIEVLSALPATGNMAGRMVFLTTTGKVYRHTGTPAGAAGFTTATDGADILANSIDVGILKAGVVRVSELAADALLASRVVISDITNLYPDYDCAIPDFYISGGSLTFNRTGAAALGKRYLNLAVDASTVYAYSDWFPIEPSTEYLIRAGAWLPVTAAGQGSSQVCFTTGEVDNTGAVTALTTTIITEVTDQAYSPALIAKVSVTSDPTARVARFRLRRLGGGSGSARAGGFKVMRKAAGELIVDGTIQGSHIAANTITAGLLATSGLITNSAQIANGLITNAHIGGAIQSTNFVTGVSGWKIDKAGNAQFNALVVRSWVADGAVSDIYKAVAAGPVTIPNTAGAEVVQLTINLGAFSEGNIWKRGVSFEAYSNAAGLPVQVRIYRRFKAAGIWQPWVLIDTIEPDAGGYLPYGSSGTLAGVYDDYEYQLRTTGMGTGSASAWGMIKNMCLTAIKVVK